MFSLLKAQVAATCCAVTMLLIHICRGWARRGLRREWVCAAQATECKQGPYKWLSHKAQCLAHAARRPAVPACGREMCWDAVEGPACTRRQGFGCGSGLSAAVTALQAAAAQIAWLYAHHIV